MFQLIGKLREIETIATDSAIREIKRLRKAYGAGRWRKRKGFGLICFSDGTMWDAEVHWYEAHGIGRKELKIKRLIEQI